MIHPIFEMLLAPFSPKRIRPMLISVFIEPHERHEAIEAYHDRLTDEQIAQIFDAPDRCRIHLQFGGETIVKILDTP